MTGTSTARAGSVPSLPRARAGCRGTERRRFVEAFRGAHQRLDVHDLVAGSTVLVVVGNHKAAALEGSVLPNRTLDDHSDAITEELGRYAARDHVDGAGAIGHVELQVRDAVSALHGTHRHLPAQPDGGANCLVASGVQLLRPPVVDEVLA